jgi:hypothetical protein
MVDTPDWLSHLDISPVLAVVAVLIAVAVVGGLIVGGVPSGRALLPSTLGVFVLLMVLVDIQRRRS